MRPASQGLPWNAKEAANSKRSRDAANLPPSQRQAARLEPDLLRKDAEHIKEIVFMQQDFARITRLAEPLTPDLSVGGASRTTVDGSLLHSEKSGAVARRAPSILKLLIAQMEAVA